MNYDPIILKGDRVALAPHTDDWARGDRYGTVLNTHTITTHDGRIVNQFAVSLAVSGRLRIFLGTDLLGAVR